MSTHFNSKIPFSNQKSSCCFSFPSAPSSHQMVNTRLLWLIVSLFDSSVQFDKEKPNHDPKFTHVHVSLYLRVLSIHFYKSGKKIQLFVHFYVCFCYSFSACHLSFLTKSGISPFNLFCCCFFFINMVGVECFPADFIQYDHKFHQRGIYTRKTKINIIYTLHNIHTNKHSPHNKYNYTFKIQPR